MQEIISGASSCLGTTLIDVNSVDQPIEIDTPLFTGRIYLWFAGTDSTPAHLFKGRKRKIWFTIQVCIDA